MALRNAHACTFNVCTRARGGRTGGSVAQVYTSSLTSLQYVYTCFTPRTLGGFMVNMLLSHIRSRPVVSVRTSPRSPSRLSSHVTRSAPHPIRLTPLPALRALQIQCMLLPSPWALLFTIFMAHAIPQTTNGIAKPDCPLPDPQQLCLPIPSLPRPALPRLIVNYHSALPRSSSTGRPEFSNSSTDCSASGTKPNLEKKECAGKSPSVNERNATRSTPRETGVIS